MTARSDFLLMNPVCCFCGQPATQEDHVPPKALFARREWPEGYVFPSCEPCNKGTRQFDQAIAMLARMGIGDENVSVEEFGRLQQGVKNNLPQAHPLIEDDTEESRRLFTELRTQLPRSGRIPEDTLVVAIDADIFRQLDAIFRKLFCALYFKHRGVIVDHSRKIFRLCTTNQILDAEDPFEWMRHPLIQNDATIVRNGKSLADQFDYSWGHTASDGVFAVVFHMRNTFFGMLVGPLPDEAMSSFEPEDVMSLAPPNKGGVT